MNAGYLLDTHTLLWVRLDPERLTAAHRKILRNLNTRKLISVISMWEMSLRFGLGKLDLDGHTLEEFFDGAQELGLQTVSPEPETFASFYRLEAVPAHKDPFDRMLIWQAIRTGLPLLSYDRTFPAYKPEGLRLA
jgi:PIN domain nuclease of toxin-antitoxin system